MSNLQLNQPTTQVIPKPSTITRPTPHRWPMQAGQHFPWMQSISRQALHGLSSRDQALFVEFGFGPAERPADTQIHLCVERWARLQPDAIAIEHQGEALTYGDLDHYANALAVTLSQLGVGVGSHVGLFVQRCFDMVIAMLAITKLRAAYVPQDARQVPKEQLSHVVRDAGIQVVLTLSGLRDRMPDLGDRTCLCLDSWRDAAPEPGAPIPSLLRIAAAPEGALNCFVLYTSGTTGKPNGVQVTQQNVCNILLTQPGNLGIEPGMKVAQLLNISFDMAAWEIWGCLAHGGTLVLRGKDFEATARQCQVLIATPSILARINPAVCPDVAVVAVAGEPCPKPLALRWAQQCRFYNCCGPTETTIVNTMKEVRQDEGPLTIGCPTPNNSVYVLNEHGEPCAIGEVGEMWAGGVCVTAGYLNNPELNADRYRPDPFLGYGMMFRTRDLGRWTANGELEHLGRTDDQVKIGGFRVELDAVSSVLEQTPGCRKAVTLKLDDHTLVAFVCPATVDTDQARDAVAQRLPYYCVPRVIYPLDGLPITSRGKVDRHQLLERARNAAPGKEVRS